MTKLALWMAVGLFVAGVLLGALPVHDYEGRGCGDAFSAAPADDDPFRDGQSSVCPTLREQARQLPIALLVLSGALALSQIPWGRLRRSQPDGPTHAAE